MKKIFACFSALIFLFALGVNRAETEKRFQGVNYSAPDLGYDFSLTEELGPIPDSPDQNIQKPNRNSLPEEFEKWYKQPLENTLARFRERGNPLAQIIYETSRIGQYVWYRGEITPRDSKGAYLGGLEQLKLVLKDRDVPVREILVTNISPDAGVNLFDTRAILLYPAGTEKVTWKEFESKTSRGGTVFPPETVHYVFLAFAKDFEPREVTGVRWGGEFIALTASDLTER